MTFSDRAIEAAAAKLTDDGVFERDEWYDHPVVKRKRRRALKMARSALSAALAVDGLALQGWRTIDSAPKDGRYILLGRFRGSELKWVKHSRWMTAEDAAEQENGLPDDYDAGWTDGEDESDYCYGATHWQPLPVPPLTAASDGEVG